MRQNCRGRGGGEGGGEAGARGTLLRVSAEEE